MSSRNVLLTHSGSFFLSLSLSLSLHFFRVIEQCAGGWCRYRVVGLSVLWEGREEGDRRDHGER
jgi:hypothetical protein